ncbi:MAG TPA: MerR family transcriptional regulator [Candidatus Paenibacillus intestinavium]|nr:MerR family transcriptional regulator [Candidatus Paenibacillus intestinavium]
MNVKEVSQLVGISIRTLHHYDEIGLLKPDQHTAAGYRQYSPHNLQTLQHILFFKELGFSLKLIKEMIQRPTFDSSDALELQRKSLIAKRSQYDKMIATIEHTIAHLKGEKTMSAKEKFDGLQWDHNPYEQEARERWGDEAVNHSQKKMNAFSTEQQSAISEQWEQLYRQLASRIGTAVDSPETEQLITEWFQMLNNNFGTYSYDAFIGLGQMYVLDERFSTNIDRYGAGLAQYMCDAMEHWGNKQL